MWGASSYNTGNESEMILREVLNHIAFSNNSTHKLPRHELVKRLKPILAFVLRLHWRAGKTGESETTLKNFAYNYLTGKLPIYD